MEKRWAQVDAGDEATITELAQALNVDECLAKILVQRGITNFEDARYFFRPTLNQLHDPFLMMDMELAINRITKALQGNERILVYGDYDVDGTTSVALTYSFFSQFTAEIAYYIPDRHKEGYGISTAGIDFA
ncbi:MAG: single-stranded-DNA-specific exonuclease RecJ, partial [Pedobacter sp.]